MVEKGIVDMIEKQSKQGIQEQQILKNLSEIGWKQEEIAEAYAFFKDINTPLPDKPASKSKKRLITVLSIVLAFLLLSSGALGFYYFFLSPTRVLQKMVLNISEVETFEYSGDIKAVGDVNEVLGEDASIVSSMSADGVSSSTFNFNGKADISDLKQPKVLFSFDLSSDILGEQTNLGLELRFIEKKAYIHLRDVGQLLDIFGLSSLNGQWVHIDATSSLEEKSISFDTSDLLKKGPEIVMITDTLEAQDIDGVNTFHYSYEINKDALKQYLKDLASANEGSVQDLTDIDHSFEKIEYINGEIWIGKKDSFPYKLTLNLKAKDIEDTSSSQELNLTIYLKNFNMPVQIDIPSESKSIEEIVSEMQNMFMPQY